MSVTTFDAMVNDVYSRLRQPYTPGDGVVHVYDATDFLAPSRIKLFDGIGGYATTVNYSILTLTGIDTSNPSDHRLIVGSAVEGTTDVPVPVRATAAQWTTAGQYTALASAINALEAGGNAPVTSVAGKTGNVTLVEADVTGLVADLASKAPLASPALTGSPTAPTPATSDSSTALATTAFVKGQGYLTSAPVTSVAGRTGAVTLQESDVAGLTSDLASKAPLASPSLTGTPTAPTPATSDNSTTLATTAYVKGQGYLTSAPVTSVAGKTGAVTLVEADIANLVSDLAAKASDSSVVHLAGTETVTGSKTYSLPIQGSVTGSAGSLSATLAIAQGGTGQTTAANAINALVPSQTGNSGKVLSTNGTSVSWLLPNTVAGVSGQLQYNNGGVQAGANVYQTSSGSIGVNTSSPLGSFQVGPTGTDGTFRVVNNGQSSYFGIYDNGRGRFYGIANALANPIPNTVLLGGWYNGLGILGAPGGTFPMFGVNDTNQQGGGYGIGKNHFHVGADHLVTTYFNQLDSSNGSAQFNGPIGFYGAAPSTKPSVTGSKGGNAALGSLITALATLGLITDNTTA